MADNFGARIDGKYRVVFSVPDVCFTRSWKPVPFPSQETLDNSAKYASKTNFNGYKVFMLKSHTTQVSGDKKGKKKGIVSRTVEDWAEPFDPNAAQSFNVEGSKVIRVGDTVFINKKNTIGKVVFQAAPTEPDITDKGKISPSAEEQSMFDDLSDWMASGAKAVSSIAKVAATAQSVLSLMGKGNSSAPTAIAAAGALGSMLGSPVMLRTGQLLYDESLIELTGSMPITLDLHYVARESYTGVFGKQWFFEYESRFERLDTQVHQPIAHQPIQYRLYLTDGRKFDFIYNEQSESFEDQGQLGVQISWNDKQFILDYHGAQHDTKQAIYQNSRLIEQRDNNDNNIKLSYDEAGRLTQIKNNSDAFFAFDYNQGKNNTQAATVSDQSGRSWQFRYDEAQNLRSITTPTGGKRLYHYQRFAEPNNRDAYLLTTVTNSLDHPILIARYNEAGQVESYQELEDNIEYQYSYADAHTIAKTSEHDDNLTYHLDEHGLVDSITLENGQTASQHYNDKTRTASITHYNGETETNVFDDLGRLTAHTGTTGEETHYQYQGKNPEPSLIKLQTGEINNRYDSHYNLLSTTDEKDRTVKYAYNRRGDITQITDAAKNKTQYQYNSFSQPEAIIDAKGNTTKIEYDELGREQKLIDAEGRETQVKYNHNDAVTDLVDPLNHPIGFSYNHEGQLQSISDPAGKKTRFEFDKNGRLAKQIKPDNSAFHYEYTEQGRVKKLSRGDGSVIRFEHNDKGLLIRQIAENHSAEKLITDFEYDTSENLIAAKNQDSILRFSYSNEGEIDGEEQNGITIEKAHHKRLKTSLSFLDKQVTFLRDPEGLLQGILDNDKPSIRFEYNDQDELLTLRQYRNKQQEKITYDDLGTIKKIKTAQQSIKYKSDKTGLITKKGETHYQYDKNGRLIKAGSETYDYDALGNQTQNHYHPQTNQLLENETHSFKYDARGNLNSKTHKQSQSTLNFEFSHLDQLIRVSGEQYNDITKQSNTLELEYQYDALNRRITKTKNGITEHYLYDQLNIIAILDENHQTKATIIHDDEIDTPLSITNQHGTFYYHRDHQGSIIALTNENGDTVESIKYDDSYGKIVEHQRIIETNNPYCYTGRELETYELYYYRARYYDPTTQQFLSEDPIGFLSGDYNFYRYVGNDPVNYWDPSGLEAYYADRLGFWIEGGGGRFNNFIGNTKPIGDSYNEIIKINNRFYHKNTSNIFSKIRNYFGDDAVEHKPYEPTEVDGFRALPEVIGALKGAKIVSKLIKKRKKRKKKKCSDISGKKTELKMDLYYKTLGYDKINSWAHQGIDGIYKKDGTPPKYIIADAKFGSAQLSRTKDGTRQMSKKWIDDRLSKHLTEEEVLNIEKYGYKPEVFEVDKETCKASIKPVKQRWRKEASTSMGKHRKKRK